MEFTMEVKISGDNFGSQKDLVFENAELTFNYLGPKPLVDKLIAAINEELKCKEKS